MRHIELRSVIYSPGYCDMLGGYHRVSLEKDGDGNWAYVCSSSEERSEPTVVCTYAVTEDAVKRFAGFITEKRVASLEKRRKSDMFATDYSPWSWSINYDTVSFGKTKRNHCSIGEYKKYSDSDHKLLEELRERFFALRGEKLSERTED